MGVCEGVAELTLLSSVTTRYATLTGQESPSAVKTLPTQPRNPCPLSGVTGLFPSADIAALEMLS